MPPFSSSLFWDCDLKSLDPEAHRAFIIGRVLTRGRWDDWQMLKRLYGFDRLRAEVVKLRCLDPRTLAFCVAYFDIPKKNFRCVTKRPSLSPAPSIS